MLRKLNPILALAAGLVGGLASRWNGHEFWRASVSMIRPVSQ